MRLILPALLVIVVLSSGCTQSSPDPEDRFAEFIEKSQVLPDGSFSYKLTLGSEDTGQTMSLGSISVYMDVYSLRGDTKTVISMSILGSSVNTAVFNTSGRQIVCTESPLLGQEGISCSVSTDYENPYSGMIQSNFAEAIEDMNIKYLGRKDVAGRRCQDFLLDLQPEDLSRMFGGSIGESIGGSETPEGYETNGEDISVEMEVCFDEQLSFASLLDITVYRYSELAGKDTVAMELSMVLQDYDPSGASSQDFHIPVDISLTDLECASDEISFTLTALNSLSGQATATLSPYLSTDAPEQEFTLTIDGMGPGADKSFSITPDFEPASGTNILEVCPASGKCAQGTCYYYSTQTSYPEFCEDSDGGAVYQTKGSVTYSYGAYNLTQEDACIDSYTLYEYYCSGNYLDSDFVTCDDGCEDGACITSNVSAGLAGLALSSFFPET